MSVRSADYAAQVEEWRDQDAPTDWLDGFDRLGVEISGRRLLDCGCGTARIGGLLAGRGAMVIGLDREVMCLRVAATGSGYTGLILGLGQQLPIREGSLDVVLLRYVLHHNGVHDRRNLLRAIHRSLSRRGTLIIETSFHDQLARQIDLQSFAPLLRATLDMYPDRGVIDELLELTGFRKMAEVEVIQHHAPYPSVDDALARSVRLVTSGRGPTAWLRLSPVDRERFHAERASRLPLLFGEGLVPRERHGTFVVAVPDA